MKKIAIIGTAGVPGKYGGFETLVHHLVQEIGNDLEFTVYCSKKMYPPEQRVNTWHGAKLHYLPMNANGAQSVIYDITSIGHAIFTSDVLLILGVSGCIVLPLVRWLTRKKIIVNIDGLEWKRDKWSNVVKRFLKLSERIAVRYAHDTVTDNIALQRYTAQEYGNKSHLIEYGANHVNKESIDNVDFSGQQKVRNYINSHQENYYMKVCRIEPENNIHVVLEAFSEIKKASLVIVGNWNNSDYGKLLKQKYGNVENITLFDPIYNQPVLDQLRCKCKCYIHGHSAGGTNPSLIEAMYLGLPIVAFSVIYNKETTEFKAKYFQNKTDLKNIIERLSVKEVQQVGIDMLEIARRRYTWPIIAKRYTDLMKN